MEKKQAPGKSEGVVAHEKRTRYQFNAEFIEKSKCSVACSPENIVTFPCSHLQPLAKWLLKWLQVLQVKWLLEASGCKWLLKWLQVAASQVAAGSKWLQVAAQVAASGCKSSGCWKQVAASGCSSGCKWLQVKWLLEASGCKWLLKWLQVAAGSKWLQVAAFWKIKIYVRCTLSDNSEACLLLLPAKFLAGDMVCSLNSQADEKGRLGSMLV